MKTCLSVTLMRTGMLVLMIVLGAGCSLFDEHINRTAPADRVGISVKYDPKSCSDEFPLLITFTNLSDKTVHKSAFDIGVRKTGYSEDINKWTYMKYSTDKIIAIGKTDTSCWNVPEFKDGFKKYNHKDELPSLNFSIAGKKIVFAPN